MRVLRWFACSLLLLPAAWAADTTVKVVDPQSAVIAGAYLFSVLWFARSERWFGTGKRVRIPRCRATVSEEPAAGHWASPGKAGGPIADCTG